jgi:hypothetical protein
MLPHPLRPAFPPKLVPLLLHLLLLLCLPLLLRLLLLLCLPLLLLGC